MECVVSIPFKVYHIVRKLTEGYGNGPYTNNNAFYYSLFLYRDLYVGYYAVYDFIAPNILGLLYSTYLSVYLSICSVILPPPPSPPPYSGSVSSRSQTEPLDSPSALRILCHFDRERERRGRLGQGCYSGARGHQHRWTQVYLFMHLNFPFLWLEENWLVKWKPVKPFIYDNKLKLKDCGVCFVVLHCGGMCRHRFVDDIVIPCFGQYCIYREHKEGKEDPPSPTPITPLVSVR